MRVLVSGATGLIGRQVVEGLAAAGHQPVGLSRRPPAGDAAAWRVGDVRDPVSLRRALAGMDAVIHCVQFPGHPVENPRRGWTYDAIDGEGTTHMAAARAAVGVPRCLYFSGVGVAPGRPEPWFRAKWRAEEAIRASGPGWSILRPSWVYGPRDRSLNRLAELTRRLPFVPVIGSGEARVRPLHVDDAALAAVRALELPEACEQVLELGGPDLLTMNQILLALQEALGVRRPLLHSPAWLVRLAAGVLQHLPNPPLSPGAVDFLLMEEPLDPRPAAELLGVRFRPLAEGLAHLRRRA